MSDEFEKAYKREKAARLAAEKLLENSSRELYFKNKQLEEANESLKRNQQTLVQQEKMASVGFLASGIAHEINNPLGYSLSNLTVLSEYAEDLGRLLQAIASSEDLDQVKSKLADDDVKHILADLPELIEESITGLENVKQIVGDIRGFARSGDHAAVSAQINDGIRTTLNVLKGQIKNKYQVEISLGELPEVSCQIGKLNQVFANIIMNATHAMPDGGVVYVNSFVDGQAVVVEISDDGPGVPEANLSEIFSPFFTTKPVGQGTGLGLSICYSIVVEDHGGNLTVANGSGRGTGATFRISIPLKDASA